MYSYILSVLMHNLPRLEMWFIVLVMIFVFFYIRLSSIDATAASGCYRNFRAIHLRASFDLFCVTKLKMVVSPLEITRFGRSDDISLLAVYT